MVSSVAERDTPTAKGGGSGKGEDAPKRAKGSYVGAPACYALDLACADIERAFGGYGCYLVGSATERPDWRDIDVRLIMADDEFFALFPSADRYGPNYQFDTRWLLLTVAVSAHLSKVTALPVDFQFQPQGHANVRHKGERRLALGVLVGRPPEAAPIEVPEGAVGAAERDVGRWVYSRIESLMSAKGGTPEGDELSYLAAAVQHVEEYGFEACEGEPLNTPPHPEDAGTSGKRGG